MQNRIEPSYFVIIISAIFPFLGFWQMNLMNVLGTFLSHNLSHMEISCLSASYIYADGVCLIPVGLLLDRYSTKYVMLFGVIVFSLGLFIFALANNFYIMCLARVVIGSGHAFALMSSFRLINLLIPNNRQASWISTVLMIAFCGGLLAQAPSLVIIGYLGWHGLIWLTLIISLLLGMFLLLIVPNNKLIKQNSSITSNLLTIITVLLNGKNWLSALFIGAMDIPIMILGSVFGLQFLHSKQISSEDGSIITATIYLGTIIGSLFFGYLLDRVKNKSILVLVASFVVCSLLSMAIFINLNLHMIYVVIFGLCGFFSSIQSVGYARVSSFNPREVISTAMSLVNVILMFIIASLQIGFSYLYNSLEIKAFYVLAFIIIAGGIVGASLCLVDQNKGHI